MTDLTRRFVLFLVDGLRPDGMLQASTPVIDQLIGQGVHTLQARTVMPSMTLPCHMSLFLGVPPARHGITTNVWSPPVRPIPGLFEVLQQAGYRTAAFYNWEELRDVARPGALNASFMVKDTSFDGRADGAVAEQAAAWLATNDFNFAFVYFGGTDWAGHLYGWMSDGYLEAIAHADRCIGRVLAALPPGCAVMVTSDHGGHEQTHGTDLPEDMTTPLVVSGGGATLREGLQITDIAPTVAGYFGVKAPAEWVGSAIWGG